MPLLQASSWSGAKREQVRFSINLKYYWSFKTNHFEDEICFLTLFQGHHFL